MSGPSIPYSDDDWIPDEEDLYRQILEQWIHYDKIRGQHRLVSAAFRDRTEDKRVSVDRSSLTTAEETFARGRACHVGVVAVTAGDVRSLGETVTPEPTDDNPAHAVIPNPTKAHARKLAHEFAKWVYPPNKNPLA